MKIRKAIPSSLHNIDFVMRSSHNLEIMDREINLIEGDFTPSEAADLINELVDVKLNFHKLHRLSLTERDRNDTCEFDNSRIDELHTDKIKNRDFFKSLKKQGKKLQIKSIIEITVVD